MRNGLTNQAYQHYLNQLEAGRFQIYKLSMLLQQF